MAGNYPDVPGHRMAIDRDGTLGFHIENGVVTQLSASQMRAMNDESDSTVYDFYGNYPPLRNWGVIFPEARDVVGHYLAAFAFSTFDSLETSTDTTNGLDGTWAAASGLPADEDAPTPAKMRSNIISVTWNGIKGVRFRLGGGGTASRARFRTWHLYGTPSASAAPNRLRFWHPTNDVEVSGAHFDWGDTPRNADILREFRIKNPSAQTANNVTLTREALTDTTPTNVSQHTFSADGGVTWATSLDIGNLAPGAVSGVIAVRRLVPPDAALSLWWARLVASAASYT